MLNITGQLSQELQSCLPESYELLQNSNLTIHPAVYQVVLSGSRGPKGGFRPESDIDLSLLVDSGMLSGADDKEDFLRSVIERTLNHWKSTIEIDTVVVFDQKNCGLKCFREKAFPDVHCEKTENDCLGLYKIQKGFSGFVPPIGVRIEKVFPLMTIWEKDKQK